jgi:hypothetical protein
MTKNKQELKEMEKELDKIPLWKLIIYTSNIEKELVALKKQGLNSKNNLMQKKRWRRNTYRNLLRKKLIKWKRNPDSVNDIMDFNTVIEPEYLGEK